MLVPLQKRKPPGQAAARENLEPHRSAVGRQLNAGPRVRALTAIATQLNRKAATGPASVRGAVAQLLRGGAAADRLRGYARSLHGDRSYGTGLAQRRADNRVAQRVKALDASDNSGSETVPGLSQDLVDQILTAKGPEQRQAVLVKLYEFLGPRYVEDDLRGHIIVKYESSGSDRGVFQPRQPPWGDSDPETMDSSAIGGTLIITPAAFDEGAATVYSTFRHELIHAEQFRVHQKKRVELWNARGSSASSSGRPKRTGGDPTAAKNDFDRNNKFVAISDEHHTGGVAREDVHKPGAADWSKDEEKTIKEGVGSVAQFDKHLKAFFKNISEIDTHSWEVMNADHTGMSKRPTFYGEWKGKLENFLKDLEGAEKSLEAVQAVMPQWEHYKQQSLSAQEKAGKAIAEAQKRLSPAAASHTGGASASSSSTAIVPAAPVADPQADQVEEKSSAPQSSSASSSAARARRKRKPEREHSRSPVTALEDSDPDADEDEHSDAEPSAAQSEHSNPASME